ncbi:hypothetical protein F503_02229 [Ophiostoma piceae UAMH 11346]|uniref:Uncharacterized protein n=1 Tax=Ophiostoma piceae (strain UAMH 11346) TaxID=1262450 RepID=S3CXB2_OPHP1|nr:hypothetical protein F503_02229 [Ophiostoma piceae UAMH 11346]
MSQYPPQYAQQLSPQYAQQLSPQNVYQLSPPYEPQFSPQYVPRPSPHYASPYSPHYSSQYSPQYAPQFKSRSSSPAPTWAFITFRVITIALSVPLIVVTSKLVYRWPSIFNKAAIALVAGALAIISDLVVVKLFLTRSRYFSMIIILDISIVILAIVAIVEFVQSDASDDDDVATSQTKIHDQYATDRILGLAFSFIVCGVRIFSAIINSIVACMMRSKSPTRPRSRTVHVVRATEELY